MQFVIFIYIIFYVCLVFLNVKFSKTYIFIVKEGATLDIGNKIKRLRIEKQLTQEELANRCELSKGFISQVENDLTSPSIATLVDILEILGTNLPEFFNDFKNEKVTFSNEDMFETEDEELNYKLKWKSRRERL